MGEKKVQFKAIVNQKLRVGFIMFLITMEVK